MMLIRKRSCLLSKFVFQFWLLTLHKIHIEAQMSENTCRHSVSDPDYPLVQIYDQQLTVGEKVYETTVVLHSYVSNTFPWNPFYDTAICYYGGSDHPDCVGCGNEVTQPPLLGFLSMDFVEVTIEDELVPTEKDTMLVTYSVHYNITALQQTPNINGTAIQDTIGNYQELNKQLGRDTCELSEQYIVNTTEDTFAFEGNNPCGPESCSGFYMFCEENPNDFSGCCKSICKANFCANDGACQHNQTNVKPLCYCSSANPSLYWYIGEKCQRFLGLWMIVLPIVLSFVAIVVAIIIACCCYDSKKSKRKKEMELEQQKAELSRFSNMAYVHEENKEDPNEQLGVRFDRYDYVARSSITTDRESTNKRVSVERYQEKRKPSCSSSSESDEDETEPSASDTWSVKTEQGAFTHHFEYEDGPYEIQTYDRGTSPIPTSATPPVAFSKSKNVAAGTRAGWTPSLGPQIPHYDNVPIDLKAFFPDTHI